jgi:2,5-furandicarboxylate decarboxylase 1
LLALSREAKVMRAVEQSGAKIKAVSLVPTIMSAVVSIEKQFEGEPKNVAAAAFGAYSWLKYCVVVDHDVDVFDINDVWWAMATRSDVGKGLLQMQGALGFPRDLFQIHQSKLGIDATAPLDQWQEFERKRIPGFETMNLQDYLG